MQQEEQIIRTEYSELMQKSYIDYAMSVIIARALPDVRDGLKPVQRRTLYDMYELGIRYDKPYGTACHTVNVRVLSAIPWVNIIHMATVLFMTHLLSWHRNLRKGCRL